MSDHARSSFDATLTVMIIITCTTAVIIASVNFKRKGMEAHVQSPISRLESGDAIEIHDSVMVMSGGHEDEVDSGQYP